MGLSEFGHERKFDISNFMQGLVGGEVNALSAVAVGRLPRVSDRYRTASGDGDCSDSRVTAQDVDEPDRTSLEQCPRQHAMILIRRPLRNRDVDVSE